MPGSIQVRLSPRSAINILAGYENEVFQVRVTAPPINGAANTALIALLSDLTGVPKTTIQIVSGQSSRIKRVEWQTLELNELISRLEFHVASKDK